MKHKYYTGELRYDRFNYVWIHDGDKFIPLKDEKGNQITVSEIDMVVFPFELCDDPSKEDSRLFSILDRIEDKLNMVLDKNYMKKQRPQEEIIKRLKELRAELSKWNVDYVSKVIVEKEIDKCLYQENSEKMICNS